MRNLYIAKQKEDIRTRSFRSRVFTYQTLQQLVLGFCDSLHDFHFAISVVEFRTTQNVTLDVACRPIWILPSKCVLVYMATSSDCASRSSQRHLFCPDQV